MCGFVVLAGCADEAQRGLVVRRMLDTITHRGPDDHGTLDDGLAAFGFRRLSILDLSPGGHQPMTSGCGRYSIVFNGEIYNYVELRQELMALGHRFVSRGDTEVLLHAYMQWGADALPRLNGMWAFVIIDRVKRILFGSRDRFGIKPLYRHRTAAGLTLMASEIKAIHASGLYAWSPDLRTCADFLADGLQEHTQRSFHAGIELVPPAHSFTLDAEGRYTETAYWRPEDFPERDVADPTETFARLFEDAMSLHMRSDVPVGVHLSGGLDSSSIACAAARIRASTQAQGPLVSFSFMDHEFDESTYIRDTLAQTGAQHHVLRTDAQAVWRDLPDMLRMQDEPVHSMTPVISYQLMRATAEQGIRVVLNGQGADETLAGYGSYFRDAWISALSDGLPRAWREVQRYAEARGEPAQRLFKGLLVHALKSQLRRSSLYRRAADRRYRAALEAQRWLSPEMTRLATGHPEYEAPDLRSQLIHDLRASPLPLYLRTEDRNSMAHSVEARVPFLDHRIVELALSLKREWKIDANLNKVVLRRAMRGRIPDSVQSRQEKMGFPTPQERWLRGELHDVARDTLERTRHRLQPFVETDAVLDLLARHRAKAGRFDTQVFRALQLGLWLDSHASP